MLRFIIQFTFISPDTLAKANHQSAVKMQYIFKGAASDPSEIVIKRPKIKRGHALAPQICPMNYHPTSFLVTFPETLN